MNSTEIVYKKEPVEQAIKMLNECRTELYDADCLIYEAMIKLVNAKGYPLVEQEDTFIDSKMPEKLMTDLRARIKEVILNLTSKTKLLEDYIEASAKDASTDLAAFANPQKDPGIGFKASSTVTDTSEPRDYSMDERKAQNIGIATGMVGASAAGTIIKFDHDEDEKIIDDWLNNKEEKEDKKEEKKQDE